MIKRDNYLREPERLITKHGRPAGITLARPAGPNRPGYSIRVCINGHDTLYGITAFDFNDQYHRAVDSYIAFAELELTDAQRERFYQTKIAFLEHYGIGFREVVTIVPVFS